MGTAGKCGLDATDTAERRLAWVPFQLNTWLVLAEHPLPGKSIPVGSNAPGSACWARTGQLSDGPVTRKSNNGAFVEAEASEPSWTRVELRWRTATSPALERWGL